MPGHKGWGNLSPSYRHRPERHGILRSAYEAGVALGRARGHLGRGERLISEPSRQRAPHYQPTPNDRIVSAIMDLPALGGRALVCLGEPVSAAGQG